jgi:hypothetical protein
MQDASWWTEPVLGRVVMVLCRGGVALYVAFGEPQSIGRRGACCVYLAPVQQPERPANHTQTADPLVRCVPRGSRVKPAERCGLQAADAIVAAGTWRLLLIAIST